MASELKKISAKHRNVKAIIGFNEELAHFIEGGSDFFLMPSRYEPCGLNQMYSLAYGAIPIVTKTGGFLDTVEPYRPETGEGTGFLIREATPRDIFTAVENAITVWSSRKDHIKTMMRRGMKKRFSWNTSAAKYETIYQRLLSSIEKPTI